VQKFNSRLLAVLVLHCFTRAYAAPPVIGLAMASGSFRVNQMEVQGSATLLEGTTVATNEASSKLKLNGGSHITLGSDSQAKIFAARAILERGATEVYTSARYAVDARTLQVAPLTPKSIARVQLDGEKAVLVSAISGPVKVTTAGGVLLANILAGSSLRFEPQAADPDTYDVTGCLLRKAGRFIIVDATSGQVLELRGSTPERELGNRVRAIGAKMSYITPMEGAAHVMQVKTLTQVAPGGCIATAASIGAESGATQPGAVETTKPASAPKAGGANKAVIAGVAIAGGAGAAIAVAMASKNKSK
jgi:hypothetical protein